MGAFAPRSPMGPMASCLSGEPGSEGSSKPTEDKARKLRPPDSAVLALLWGSPIRVLLVRKSCSPGGYWSCDAALPGGSIERGETPVEAALREAWEEAWIHPSTVRVIGVMEPEEARGGERVIAPVVALHSGASDYMPRSGEIDFAAWIPLATVSGEPRPVRHPLRGLVSGYELPGGIVVWGATMRVLRRLYRALRHCGAPVDP